MKSVDLSNYITERPLSYPSSTSPTSPIASSCCDCVRLCKSTNAIFQSRDQLPNATNSSQESRKSSTDAWRSSKFSWSVFKRKEQGQEKLKSSSRSQDNSEPPLIKLSSWVYFETPSNPRRKVLNGEAGSVNLASSHEMRQKHGNKEKDEKKIFRLIPTINIDPTSSETPPSSNSQIISRNNPESSDLRGMLLHKSVASSTKKKNEISLYVPRSPGPLDGSLYAQVTKNRSSRKMPSHLLKKDEETLRRGYCSVGELRKDVVCSRESSASFHYDCHGNHVESNPSGAVTSKPVASIRICDVDLLRDCTNVPLTSVDDLTNESGYHTISSMTMTSESKPEMKNEIDILKTMQLATSRESGSLSQQSDIVTSHKIKSISDRDRQEIRKGGGGLKAYDNNMTSQDMTNKDITVHFPDDNWNELLVTSTNSRTQREVDNAMALINECLSEQALRSGDTFSMNPAPNIQDLENLPPCPIVKMEDMDLIEDPIQSASDLPVSWRQKYGEGSSKYSLTSSQDFKIDGTPPRTVPVVAMDTRTESHLPKEAESALNSAIAELVEDTAPLWMNDGKRIAHQRSSEDSLDSIAPIISMNSLRNATSFSDVDSGIDGSACTNQVQNKNDLSKTVQRSCVDAHSKVGVDGEAEVKKYGDEIEGEEEEEERRVRVEIEHTQMKLAILQEQQKKIKKERVERGKRHSLGYITFPTLKNSKATIVNQSVSNTLPRRPSHGMKNSQSEYSVDATSKTNSKEQFNLDELLHSIQQLDAISLRHNNVTTAEDTSAMISTVMTVDPVTPYTPYPDRSAAFTASDSDSVRRVNTFTPTTYPVMQQDLQKNEEKLFQQLADNRIISLMQEQQQSDEISSNKQKQKEFKVHEQQEENATSSKETFEFLTMKSKQESSQKSEDLQSQLDDLDLCIAQSTQNANVSEILPPSGNDVIRRRCHSIGVGRMRNHGSSIHATKSFNRKTNPAPRPLSRTRSSHDSVSRRLSHGSEIAGMIRENSIERNSRHSTKEDIFTRQTPHSSYPPLTSHTRPSQQQIIAKNNLSSKLNDQRKMLSSQLVEKINVNPGGKLTKNNNNGEAALVSNNVVDVAPPGTPEFPSDPISPGTPYVNSISPSGNYIPALFKQNSHSGMPVDVTMKDNGQGRTYLASATRQHTVNGTVTSQTRLIEGHPANHISSSLKESTLHDGDDLLETKDNYPNNSSLATFYNTQRNSPSYPHNDSSFASSQTGGNRMGKDRQMMRNGWQHPTSLPLQLDGKVQIDTELKSPWIHSGSASPAVSTPTSRSPGGALAFTYPSGGISPSGPGSLNGSHDSLLSDASSSGRHHVQHPHHAYQQQRYNGSNPSLPKDAFRNSGSSMRSSSTGASGKTPQRSPQSAGSMIPNAGSQYSFASSNRRESQSSYEKHGSQQHPRHFSSDDGGLSNPTSERTSSSSITDIEKLSHEISHSHLGGQPPPKFIRDTTAYWYKADIGRDQALAMLRSRPAGSFVVRDSRFYPGAFGLALKVNEVPAAVMATAKPGTDMNNELVRHFLIEPSTRGVKLKGCANEPVFGSLSALIYQHSITPLALPCKLIIPTENQEVPQQVGSGKSSTETTNSAAELLRQGAACNVVYLGSADTESLTGPEAIERAMRECTQNAECNQNIKTSVVHFKVSPQGITLTDNARKIFFRRHYPTNSVTYCGMDPSAREPHNRTWDASKYRGSTTARMFGFVARKTGGCADNVCHLFAELDRDQPASAIVNFVSKVLLGTR